nr:MAG: hypothetical protein DIU68_21250 [Chloroflexota bacterium]
MHKTLIPLLLIGLAALLLATVAFAQEATPEPLPAEPAPGIDWGAWLDRLQTAASISFIIGGLLGAAAGGGSALMILSRIDKQTKDQTERLFESLSPEWQATIVRVVESAEEAGWTAGGGGRGLQEGNKGQAHTV